MNEAHRRQVAALFDALELSSADEFSFAGRRFTAFEPLPGPDSPSASRDGLIAEMTRVLYLCGYSRLFDGTADAARNGYADSDARFVERLALANCNRRESAQQPGFYLAAGENLPHELDWSRMRFYFHATSDVAVGLLAELSASFNRYEVPFIFKCLADPAAYDRSDACVLFLARKHFRLAVRIVDALPDKLLAGLRPAVPLFARELRTGIGITEDPGNGESFGQHRCRLLAESALAAAERGQQDTASRLEAFVQRFRAEGLDADRPHLNAGSADFALPPRQPLRSYSARAVASCDTSTSTRFLEVAARIGCRVTRDALWAGDRCNWIGAFHAESQSSRQLLQAAHGPGLWAGTSGIGLFLARLYAATSEPLHRETAIGALLQSAAGIECLDASLQLDFHSGAVGIAYALAMAAADLDCPRLRDSAADILRTIVADTHVADSAACGTAAAIVGLLAIARRLGSNELVPVAERLGDALVNSAVVEHGGPDWRCNQEVTFGESDLPAVTEHGGPVWRCDGQPRRGGLEHGDATIEVCRALLSLHAVTGALRFRDPALAAYASICRHVDQLGAPAARCCAGPVSWLSWLSCCELATDNYIARIHDSRFATMDRASRLGGTADDFSLGSGSCGECEVLLALSQLHCDDNWRQLAVAMGDLFSSHVPARAGRATLTATGEETYNLFRGQSGIGYTYLRLYDPRIASCLVGTRAEITG